MLSKRLLWRQVLLFILARLAVHTAIRMVNPFLPAFGRGLGVDLAAMAAADLPSMACMPVRGTPFGPLRV